MSKQKEADIINTLAVSYARTLYAQSGNLIQSGIRPHTAIMIVCDATLSALIAMLRFSGLEGEELKKSLSARVDYQMSLPLRAYDANGTDLEPLRPN